MKIFILENSNIQYDGCDRNNPTLRGAELAIINYSEELAARNHDVFVLNNCKKESKINKVHYLNINKNNELFDCDIAIANADANLFNFVKSKKNFLLSHSIQNFEKFIRKKQLKSFLKFKPKVLCFSNYHYKKRSFLTSFFGKEIIIPSIDNAYFDVNLSNIENKDAIFYSRGDRNGSLVIDIWKSLHKTKNFNHKLYVSSDLYFSHNNLSDFNINKKEFMEKNELINFLKKFRILIIPGHKGEVFCNVAEEAKALCIPIITMGIGALSERVVNDYNGYLCNNLKDFENKIYHLLNNDDDYFRFRNNLMNDRGKNKWSDTTDSLIKLF